MSSYDELVAARMIGVLPDDLTTLFPKQVDWIQALVKYVRPRPDLFLLIRVHPREFPNRRERAKSQHAELLERLLKDLPDNVAVNWPTDGISLYDFADEADVFLNAWSSAGKEMALLGLPVVVYTPELLLYPAELNYVGTTVDGYFACIERALQEGWSARRVRQAYRWAAFEFTRATVFIGDGYPEVEHPHRTLLDRVLDRARRGADPLWKERRDCRRRPTRLGAADQVARLLETAQPSILELASVEQAERTTLEIETRALDAELRRLANALCPTEDARRRSRLYRAMTAYSRTAAQDDLHTRRTRIP